VRQAKILILKILKVDGYVKSHIQPLFVVLLKREVQLFQYVLDYLRAGMTGVGSFYEFIKVVR